MQHNVSSAQALKKRRQQIRVSAMNLLARREHSAKELSDKLTLRYLSLACHDKNKDGRFDDQDKASQLSPLIRGVIDELANEGLQSDQRFMESFIRVRTGQGKGALRILQELKQRGINESQAKAELQKAEVDWFELARHVYERKFNIMTGSNSRQQLDIKEQVKRQRYLSYRGFSFEQITYALNPS